MSAKILVIDDDQFLMDSVKRFLSINGFQVDTASNGEDALALIVDNCPDLALLDLGLPGVDGISLCRRIRSKWRFPVVMLTARTDAMDKVVGLEVGADDYLTKPFEPAELLARVRAHLRRSQEYAQEPKPTIESDFRTVNVVGREIELTAKEFDLLLYLCQNSGRVISREVLFEQVWGYDIEFSSNTLDVFVYRLRQKLGNSAGSYIKTVRGVGYKIQVSDD